MAPRGTHGNHDNSERIKTFVCFLIPRVIVGMWKRPGQMVRPDHMVRPGSCKIKYGNMSQLLRWINDQDIINKIWSIRTLMDHNL